MLPILMFMLMIMLMMALGLVRCYGSAKYVFDVGVDDDVVVRAVVVTSNIFVGLLVDIDLVDEVCS